MTREAPELAAARLGAMREPLRLRILQELSKLRLRLANRVRVQ
jgi:hypothetical protein